MSILNIGSLNLDLVYQVPHFVQPGETLPSLSFHTFCGGKGLNQSVAAARAGARRRALPGNFARFGTDGTNLPDTGKRLENVRKNRNNTLKQLSEMLKQMEQRSKESLKP